LLIEFSVGWLNSQEAANFDANIVSFVERQH
jgi:hypothetical protein